MAAGGGRSGGTGSEGAAGSGCGGAVRHTKMACCCCRGGEHETASPEGRPRKMSAAKTWPGYRGDDWKENPAARKPSPSRGHRRNK